MVVVQLKLLRMKVMSKFLVNLFVSFALLVSLNANSRELGEFHMDNGNVSEFLEWITKETGKNFTLAPDAIDTKINVAVSGLDSKDAFSFFTAVMNSNGFRVIKTKSAYQVVPGFQFVELPEISSKLFKFYNARKENLKPVIETILNSGYSSDAQKETGENTADTSSLQSVVELPNSNALLVTSTKIKLNKIQSYMKQLDIKLPQVFIEAVIMESDVGVDNQVGVNLSSALLTNGFSFVSNALNPIETVNGISSLGQGGSITFTKGGDIRGLIQALTNQSNTKLLSKPNLFILDRSEGKISVGQNVPFITSTQATDSGVLQSIERQDVGITLTVKPYVLGSGEIVLDVLQESSSVTQSTQASDIITNKRSISTTTRLQTGQSMLLGGLITTEDRETVSGVPLLMDIPWVGSLFKSKTKQKVNRELSVLIKATLI